MESYFAKNAYRVLMKELIQNFNLTSCLTYFESGKAGRLSGLSEPLVSSLVPSVLYALSMVCKKGPLYNTS